MLNMSVTSFAGHACCLRGTEEYRGLLQEVFKRVPWIACKGPRATLSRSWLGFTTTLAKSGDALILVMGSRDVICSVMYGGFCSWADVACSRVGLLGCSLMSSFSLYSCAL